MRLARSLMAGLSLLVCAGPACTCMSGGLGGSPLMIVSIQDLETEVDRLMAVTSTSGLAMAVIEDGRIAHQRAFGWADRQARTPLTTDTVMHAASLTKAAFPIALGYGLGWGIYASSHGQAFFKEGHENGTSNYVLGFPASRAGLVVLSNDANAEAMFEPLIDFIYGETCDPWFWHPYIPYDRPEFSRPTARENPPRPC